MPLSGPSAAPPERTGYPGEPGIASARWPRPGSRPRASSRCASTARRCGRSTRRSFPGTSVSSSSAAPRTSPRAIRRLAIRGAPLIGVAAAYGVALELAARPLGGGARAACATPPGRPPDRGQPRRWAVDRVDAAAAARAADGRRRGRAPEARAIQAEEEAASAAIAAHGADLLAGARRILTHCNTGALAAPGRGTALAVIAELADRGTLDSVLATESRPLLQGARLTAYELARLNIPHELIVDSAAAGLIAGGAVDAVIVGCDRVAANGDVANKVGTYGLALAAQRRRHPVRGRRPDLDDRPRHARPAARSRSRSATPTRSRRRRASASRSPDTRCRNPAFDVTPAALDHRARHRARSRPVSRRTSRSPRIAPDDESRAVVRPRRRPDRGGARARAGPRRGGLRRRSPAACAAPT